jgi:hypothetical protein
LPLDREGGDVLRIDFGDEEGNVGRHAMGRGVGEEGATLPRHPLLDLPGNLSG